MHHLHSVQENKLGLSYNFIFLQFLLVEKMSATSYDSDEYSFSDDDSEFNFMPGRYWSSESGESESKDDGQTGIEPYSGEPMADEEWLKQYKLRQPEKERQLESLKNHLSGNETLSNWCQSKDQVSV